jgi:hypothetical protein
VVLYFWQVLIHKDLDLRFFFRRFAAIRSPFCLSANFCLHKRLNHIMKGSKNMKLITFLFAGVLISFAGILSAQTTSTQQADSKSTVAAPPAPNASGVALEAPKQAPLTSSTAAEPKPSAGNVVSPQARLVRPLTPASAPAPVEPKLLNPQALTGTAPPPSSLQTKSATQLTHPATTSSAAPALATPKPVTPQALTQSATVTTKPVVTEATPIVTPAPAPLQSSAPAK